MQYPSVTIWFVGIVFAAGAILVAMAIYVWALRKRVELLQRLFGSEYDNSVRVYGSRRDAAQALENHCKRLQDCGVHQLSDGERQQFLDKWRSIRNSSSADSASLMVHADSLLSEILRTQGCPVENGDERNLDLNLLYPTVAEKYAAASNILERQRLGTATFEERQKMERFLSDVFGWILESAEPEERPRKAA